MSENISAAIALNGETVTRQPLIKMMRVVKKETLNLISVWVGKSADNQMVRTSGRGLNCGSQLGAGCETVVSRDRHALGQLAS